MPKNCVWGPKDWFIKDLSEMGFPIPVFLDWVALLSEFIGGILLMINLLTLPAVLFNCRAKFTASFIYHIGDIGKSA